MDIKKKKTSKNDHGCSANMVFAFESSKSVIKRLWFRWQNLSEVVLGIGQNIIVHRWFCETDRSSINNQHVENIFTLNLGTYSLLQINKRGIQIIFFLYLQENICCGYSLEAPL